MDDQKGTRLFIMNLKALVSGKPVKVKVKPRLKYREPTQQTGLWASSRIGDGQGSLTCCSPRDYKESDTTEWLKGTELGEDLVLDWTVSYVGVLTSRISEWKHVWVKAVHFKGNYIKTRSLWWIPIWYDWWSYQKRKSGHIYTQREDNMRRLREETTIDKLSRQNEDRSFRKGSQNQPCRHLDFGLPAFRTSRKFISTV